VALAGAAVTGGLYLWKAVPTSTAPMKAPQPVQVSPPVASTRRATGGLRVQSTPVGAQVLVDGKPRGITPLTLTDLSPGRHAVGIRSDAGTVERTVTVAANETAEIDESIFPGWIAVYSPFELTIIEGGRVLRPDERGQVMLPPGTHELRLGNKALAFDEVRQIDVKPGETTVLRLTPPPSTLTVTTSEAAEVWLDGTRVGETPVDGLPVPLGTHEVVVKRASGAERRFTVTIGVNPFTLNVDFNQPAD
jgi:archaellum component FlaG (FlaF/FlaG flagellin family)